MDFICFYVIFSCCLQLTATLSHSRTAPHILDQWLLFLRKKSFSIQQQHLLVLLQSFSVREFFSEKNLFFFSCIEICLKVEVSLQGTDEQMNRHTEIWNDTPLASHQINGHIPCVKTETKSDDIETFCLFHDNASYLCLRESSDSISLFLFNHMRRIAPHKNFHFVLAIEIIETIGTEIFCIFVLSISDFVWFQFHSAFLFFCWTCFVAIDESFLRVQICNKVERTQLLFRSINVGICAKSEYFCEQMKWIHIFFSILFRCVQCLNGSNAGWCSPHSIKLQSNLIRCCSL